MSLALDTIFEHTLSVKEIRDSGLSIEQAQALFEYFKNAPLFSWADKNNDCEDRANAICMLLDAWGIPNYKGWVFSGNFLKNESGSLRNYWNYHVAALLAIEQNGNRLLFVIDPATVDKLVTLDFWAQEATEYAASYHCVTEGKVYIFKAGNIKHDTWHERDKRNYKWTIQGLAGINGVSCKGKAQLIFQKPRIKKWETRFKQLLLKRPTFLSGV